MEVIFILLISLRLTSVCQSGELQHTECLSMELLRHKEHNIICSSNERIFIATQFTKYEGQLYNRGDEDQCQNSTSATCFRSFPSEKGADFTSYFNVSKICNRKSNCVLVEGDYYYSVHEFAKSCGCCGDGAKFYRIRFILYFECLSGAQYNVDFVRNLTGKQEDSLYLEATKSNKCSINGYIESARILEQANIRLTIINYLKGCSDESPELGNFNYNRNLPCVKGLASIILDIETSADQHVASKILWMEFKGRSLQLICGDNIEAVQLEPKQLDTEESVEPLSIPVIEGPLAGALLVVVLLMIVIFKRKNSRIVSKTKEKQNVFFTPTALQHDAVYHHETNVPEIIEGLYDSMDKPMDSFPAYFPNAQSQSAEDREKITEKGESVQTTSNQVIGEVTGDVYASVCKRENLADSRITGPKGDIYTTVSLPSKTK